MRPLHYLLPAAAFWLVVLAAPLAMTQSAAAQQQHQIQGVRPEAHLGVGWHGSLGVGMRLDIPLLPEGLIDATPDELALSPGADLHFLHHHHKHDHDDEFELLLPLALQWNFYLGQWSLFPELGIALHWGHHGGHLHLGVLFAFGARYHFSPRHALVLRLSSPAGLQVGITF